MSTYTLDFSFTTDIERCEYIQNICSQSTFTIKQYTQMADYILLATSTKIIYPEEFRSPHIIHNEQSLDELLENPTTCDIIENTSIPLSQAKHAQSKRRIDRNNPQHADIPGMRDLWTIIDKYKEKLEQNPTNYHFRRILIDLYKQQYSLLENYLPNISYTNYHRLLYTPYTTNIIDYNEVQEKLCDPTYMCRFLVQLPALSELSSSTELPDILSLVNQSISLSNLTQLQQDILSLYQQNIPYTSALTYIQKHHNRTLTQSYMSIILHKQIAVKVAAEYTELYHEQIWANDPTKWRTCMCCKKTKLLTKHNWYHFSNKPQGFALICKECTKAKKENKQNANTNQ